ncbi:MAG: PAS domain S-box protein [Magnetococcales bacterium]|nr:PAS domain S-box protein [Magnetococcales bacterium]
MSSEATTKLAQPTTKTGFALWQEDGSLSHVSGALPTLTAFWPSPDAWWADVQKNITPPPPTQCPVCDRGRRVGILKVSLVYPKAPRKTPPLLFEIEFFGHPHDWIDDSYGELIFVRDITKEHQETKLVHKNIQQYESICSFIEDVYYRIDLKGRIKFISPSCEKLLRYSPDELLGKSMGDICVSPAYLRELLTILKKTDSVTDFDLVLQCKHSNHVPISLTAQVVYDENGKQVGVEGIFSDITEREQLDTLLVERTRQFQESMAKLEFQKKAIDEHHLITVINQDGVIAYVNDRVVELSQYSKEELIGRNLEIFSSGHHPKSFVKEMWRTIRNGKTWKGEVKNRKKNGEFYWVDESITPFLTSSGQPFQYISTATDISEQISSIARLEDNRKFLHSIVDALGDGIYVLDLQGQLLSLNKEGEELLGFKESELLHTNFHKAVHHTRRDGTPFKTSDCTIHQSLLGRSFRKEEDYFIRKDGSFLPISLVTSPLMDGQDIIGSAAIFRDNSQREKQRIELEETCAAALESSRLKSEFLANMSHEIRTPMSAIVGMNDLLMDTNLSDEQFGFSQIIKESSISLLALINDILDFSKIEAGKIDIEEIDFSPVTVVEGAAELMAGLAYEKELSLLTFIDPRLPNILKGDPGRLRQMLLNLINNALKFTEDGEVVVRATIESESDDDVTVLFSVSDTGVGVSKKGRKSLFEPFTQADNNTMKQGGTGLGLAITKRLTELMNGKIGIESEEGRGSTFWFQVPFKCSSITKKRDSSSLNIAPLRKRKVLTVIENKTDQEVLKQYFQSWGIEVQRCSSWEKGVAAIRIANLKRKPFDIVVLTTELSDEHAEFIDIPGFLEEEKILNNTHLIALMERDDKEQRELLLESGYGATITKPVLQSEWVETMVELLDPQAIQPKVEAIANSAEVENQKVIDPDSYDALEDGKLLLLVEDNLINQKVTLLQLKKLGYAAHTVVNGKEAVEAIDQLPYALILMDCQMPIMDGFEATHAIRNLEKVNSRHTPIIAMTANAMKGDREKCLNAGMDDYLSKPVDPENLLKKLRYWIPKGYGEQAPIDINQLRQLFGNDDGMIRELLQHFIPSSEELLGRLWEANQNQQAEELTQAAIELREACTNLGAANMAQLARNAERAVEKNDWKMAQETMDALNSAFDKVENFVAEF